MSAEPLRVVPLAAAWLEHASRDWPEELPAMRWLLSTSYATAFMAMQGDAVVGVSGGISFGATARITLMHVQKKHPEAIPALVQALTEAFEEAGASTIIRLCLPEYRTYWEKLGFRAECEFLRYSGGRHIQASSDHVVWAEPQHWMGICHLDRQASGEDRSQWLREYDYLDRVYVHDGRVRGFYLALVGNGLIIADSPEVGLELQRWLLPIQEHVTLPVGQLEVHQHLLKQGYQPSLAPIRMVRGEAVAWRREMVYGV